MKDDKTFRNVNRSGAFRFHVRYLTVAAENLPRVLLIFDTFFYKLLVKSSNLLILLLFDNFLDKEANEIEPASTNVSTCRF